MADSFVGIAEPGSITAKIDAESLVVGANTVLRERIQIAGATALQIAGVDATNGLDVDVTRIIPGTAATTLGKAIDTAVGATDTGVGMLAKRLDAPVTLTPASGDWAPPQLNSVGSMWTIVKDIHTALGQSILDDTADAVKTVLVSAAGAPLTAGSEWEDGATETDPAGPTLAYWDGTDTMHIVSTATPLPVQGTVTVGSQPVRARTTDAIAVAQQTDAVMVGGTECTPKFVAINTNTSGDNTILAAVASKKIRVLNGLLMSEGTTTTRFESGASGTALTGAMPLIANVGFVIPYSPLGNFETASNTLLNLELSAAIRVHGWLTYIEV